MMKAKTKKINTPVGEKNLKLILADDEPELREIYGLALAKKGFDVLTAQNAKEVYTWLEKEAGEVAAIILDIVMPGGDGFDALEKIGKNEKYRKIPVLMFSNLDNKDDRREAFRLGAYEYFEKSKWMPSKFADAVKKIIVEKRR